VTIAEERKFLKDEELIEILTQHLELYSQLKKQDVKYKSLLEMLINNDTTLLTDLKYTIYNYEMKIYRENYISDIFSEPIFRMDYEDKENITAFRITKGHLIDKHDLDGSYHHIVRIENRNENDYKLVEKYFELKTFYDTIKNEGIATSSVKREHEHILKRYNETSITKAEWEQLSYLVNKSKLWELKTSCYEARSDQRHANYIPVYSIEAFSTTTVRLL